MHELVLAHQANAKKKDWNPLLAMAFEPEDLRLPDVKDAKGIVVTLETGDFAIVPTRDPSPSHRERKANLAGSKTMAAIEAACADFKADAFHVLAGYAAKSVALALARASFDPPIEVDVAGIHIGRLDRNGFVPAPLSIATARIIDERAKAKAWLRENEGPPIGKYAPYHAPDHGAPRVLKHADGRTWQVTVEGDRLLFHFTDEEGNAYDRTRTSKEALWEAEALIRDQIRDGFVVG